MEAWRKLLPVAWLLVMIIVYVECGRTGPGKLPTTTVKRAKLPAITVNPAKLTTTTVKQTKVPPTTVKQTKLPPTTVKQTKLPPTTVKQTKLPPTTVKQTQLPPTTVKQTKLPPTTVKPAKLRNKNKKPAKLPKTDDKPCGNFKRAKWCTQDVDLKFALKKYYRLSPEFLQNGQPSTKPKDALYGSNKYVSFTGNKFILAILKPLDQTFSVNCMCADVGNTHKAKMTLYYPNGTQQTFTMKQKCKTINNVSYWCKACITFKSWKTVNRVILRLLGTNGLPALKGVKNIFMRACRPGEN